MKNWFRPAALAVLTTVALSAKAQQYVFDQKIAIPGDGSYDYMAIDSVNNHLFVSHGTAFNVVDLATEQPIAVIEGMKGVHGIAIVNAVNKGFISDGRGKAVVVVDLKTFEKIKTIDLEAEDEDGIMYDPYSRKVFCFCGDSKSVAVIDPQTMSLVKTIDLGGGPEFAVSDGKGLVYNNIEDQSSLKVIDVKTLAVKATYPLAPCGGPTGIAYDPGHQRLFTGCRANKGLSVVEVGVSPKTFSCIARIRAAMGMMHSKPGIRWKEIAYRLNYSDQAHFIHEFKRMSGKAPGEYFQSTTDFEQFLYGS